VPEFSFKGILHFLIIPFTIALGVSSRNDISQTSYHNNTLKFTEVFRTTHVFPLMFVNGDCKARSLI